MKLDLDISKTACFTGHRAIKPTDFYDLRRQTWNKVIELYSNYGYTDFIVGGALGYDTMAAEIIRELSYRYPQCGFKYHVYIPCPEQSADWSEEDVKKYNRLLADAASTVLVSPKYNDKCMILRNHAMVDNSSACIAYCHNTARSGTASTVRYAIKKGLRLFFVPEYLGITEESFKSRKTEE